MRTLAIILAVALAAGCNPPEPPPPPTCEEVRAAGQGPYHQGKDPEYSRYEDRDRDGIVCEE